MTDYEIQQEDKAIGQAVAFFFTFVAVVALAIIFVI